VGMAAGGSLEAVRAAARAALELIRLPRPQSGRHARTYEGALTDAALRESPPLPGETLVARDFTAIFLDPAHRRALAQQRITLAVRNPARLLAVTCNPTAPARPPMPADRFYEALREESAPTPVFDVVADLRSEP
jgi:hypothetical protein